VQTTRFSRRYKTLLAMATLCAVAVPAAMSSAHAAPLSIGLAADVTSMDPHFHLYVPNQNIADHVYDRLIHRDERLFMTPGLALTWKAVDDLTWEMKLRPNVKFHDGSPFTAEDVKFSIERVPTVKDSPGLMTTYTRAIASIEVVDPLTVRFKTSKPYPLVPNDLAIIPIVSKKAAAGATSADFNSGKAAIGTGPYKFVRFSRGDRVELTRNDNYWGSKTGWETVTFRIMTNDASRVAALLSGDVDAIDNVPVQDLARIKKDPALHVAAKTGYRLIYFGLNLTDAAASHFSTKAGAPLGTNPLHDLRVRQAINKAISRDVIVGRVMEGAGTATGQLVNSGLPGYMLDVPAGSYDPNGARDLLAKAGYPDGFKMTLHGPNNRYLMDDQIVQAVAQMLGRVGITAAVEVMPAATFFPRNNKGEFAMSLVGWAPDSAEASSPLRALIATKDPQKGLGNFNVGYSNKKVDELIERAVVTVPPQAREKLLQDATRAAMDDVALIPLHHQATVWAMKRSVNYPGRADERTHAMEFTPAAAMAALAKH
jgi:peptide/nickel transport system substrate-binding protein